MKEAPTFPHDAPVSEAATSIDSGGAGYVVDPEGRPVGVVTQDRLAGATGNVGAYAVPDFPKASTTTPLASLFHLSGGGRPVCILDGDGKMVGMVSPLDILSILGQVEVVDDPHKEVTI